MASIPQLVRESRPVTWFDDITNWGNKSADNPATAIVATSYHVQRTNELETNDRR